jgi:hypothetical protein
MQKWEFGELYSDINRINGKLHIFGKEDLETKFNVNQIG